MIIADLKAKVSLTAETEDANIINVTRHSVLDGALRGFNKKSFKLTSGLNVKFAGEYGIDAGGPSREFLTLLCRSIKDSIIFKGPPDSKFLRRDITGRFYGWEAQ